MSHTTDRGKIVFQCDNCSVYEETGESDFNDALTIIKEQGWRAIKVGTEWKHGCDRECQTRLRRGLPPLMARHQNRNAATSGRDRR